MNKPPLTEPPPEWGNDELTKFLDNAVANTYATFHNLKPEYTKLSVIDAAFRKAIDHLSHPQELLAGSRFKAFMDQLLREFELTILDTTATSRCTDAQRVATVAGYSLIVARKHKSHVKDVATLVKLLRADRSNVVGTVLNDF